MSPERILLSGPDVGPDERTALLRAFDEGWIAPVGPELDAFEDEIASLIGWPGTVAMSSGSAALHLALLRAGVSPGDDVIVSTLTFAASANAVVHCGARPVFVDSEQISWNMSPALLSEALEAARASGRLPTAVVVVDVYGQCADYDELIPQCAELGIPVVEDAAEAIGATYKGRAAGTLASSGVFSFNGNKIMTTSGGGMFVSPDVVEAGEVRYLATQARQPVAHYEHTDVGFNYRMSNLLAAVGRAQLRRLPEMIERRRAINARYRTQLADLPALEFMPVPDWSGWNGWLSCLVLDDESLRDEVQQILTLDAVESRRLWKPMHQQPVFEKAPAWVNGTSDALFARGLCLPSGSSLTDLDVDRVIHLVRSAAGHR